MNKKKTADEIIASAVYDTTDPTVIPTNQRVLCIEVPPDEIRTASGIILPKQRVTTEKGGIISKDKPRYVVAAAAGDAILIDADGKEYNLKQGDEIYPFWPPEAIDFDFPSVFDYGTLTYYTTFHTTELAGFIKAIPKEK